MERFNRNVRRSALEKIAVLAARAPHAQHKNNEVSKTSDFDRLTEQCAILDEDVDGGDGMNGKASNGSINGSINGYVKDFDASRENILSARDLEVVLALCKSVHLISSKEAASKLCQTLKPHMLNSASQLIAPSPYLRSITPCPWEVLTASLTTALATLGAKFPSLREEIVFVFGRFLRSVRKHPSLQHEMKHEREALPIATFVVSLLGFLDSAFVNVEVWRSEERVEIIKYIRDILSPEFLLTVETAFSTIRNSQDTEFRQWKRYVRHYAASGRPLGAALLQQGFAALLSATTSLLVIDSAVLKDTAVLDVLLATRLILPSSPPTSPSLEKHKMDFSRMLNRDGKARGHVDRFMVAEFAEIAAVQLAVVEDGADYLQLGSAWQQRLAFSVKAHALTAFCNCVVLHSRYSTEDIDRVDVHTASLINWLETAMDDPVQIADRNLAEVVLKIIAIVAQSERSFAVTASRLLPRFIVRGVVAKETVKVAAKCLAIVLQQLSQDAVITTLYTLGNVLAPGNPERALTATSHRESLAALEHHNLGSAISLTLNTEEEKFVVYERVIEAVVGIATYIKDDKITTLANSILNQKIDKLTPAVDAKIIVELAGLALVAGPTEMKAILKRFDRLGSRAVGSRDANIMQAVLDARIFLSQSLVTESPQKETYLISLLENIGTKGDIHEHESKRQSDVEVRNLPIEPPKLRLLGGGSSMYLHLDVIQLAAREISQLLQPLAILLSNHSKTEIQKPPYTIISNPDIQAIFRNAWFNCVVHGFLRGSDLVLNHEKFLRIIARHSPPLIPESRINQTESDMELNTVLRRGMNGQNTTEQKKKLIVALPNHDNEIRGLSYSKVIFLQAALLVESLRATEGDCSKILTYFVDPIFKSGDTANCMSSIANEVITIYIRRVLSGPHPAFGSTEVAHQLKELFSGCCHRVEKVQTISAICVDRIVSLVPSALCHQSSLFAMLELMSLLWNSCLEAETDEYAWRSVFKSPRGKVAIELSDSYALRRRTLKAFHTRAKGWVLKVLVVAPMDIRGLLQTYLSKYDDEGTFGHVSLGRSFAYEMGAIVPSSDPRLASIDHLGDCDTNIASDFIAQYTIRQAYRFEDHRPEDMPDWSEFMNYDNKEQPYHSTHGHDEAELVLAHLESRATNRKFVSIGEVRDVLRRAAGTLCHSTVSQPGIVQHFVNIPFTLFTKQSIKLGISLWMGVINENPRMAPRILSEIAQNFEVTIKRKQGLFSSKFVAPDAFYGRMEYAPSDKEVHIKHHADAVNLLSPHLRLIQFLSSHFHASRHGSTSVLRIFLRIVRLGLVGLKNACGHPLAREARFYFILFSLQVLRYTPGMLSAPLQIKLKDQILSAALSWFAFAPRWSYGGSRLQMKAEAAIMRDVMVALQAVANIGLPSVKTIESKQELVLMLLENEQQRVVTWLNPLDPSKKHGAGHTVRSVNELMMSSMVQTAWNEDPAIAIQMPVRFPGTRYSTEVRKLLLNYPEKVVHIPDALLLLLGDQLPRDVNFQLKYLLFWAPVNPVTAATYFLPSYANNPFVLQYAMRALESHSVEVTFFYVPQIVQTLRYDSLGYVERYILETAKLSRLFAHQIIWNMKANAFKDEDSEIPDPVKPTLDKVMDHLIASFSPADKSFYEREFSFFGEVTDISGKLRPFLKATKAEKKQKIEEELRKIKVDVGVYLPSNPDGVVIGIDRKSGKPLQSHAKAPYMATFRVRKKGKSTVTANDDPKDTEPKATQVGEEMWQSAIFKVGDDCRQDVLALQLISAFRSIFNGVGLDVYVYPYRVTATAPGCGVIDVLPNSISRDMLGREAVNGLYEYFVNQNGGEDSIKFQEARSNFVQSMAAYSVISYLLQFKDRHNGNIMIDDAGHILHIDFGFCFDIAPGGITFERAPFKLTAEMIAVMGGGIESQAYKWFEELCVKSFLACRPFCDQLAHCVLLMLDSGLPCFKPETIQNFRDRFVLERSERDAADFMRGLVKKAYSSYTTKGYDQFQLLTNGIPY